MLEVLSCYANYSLTFPACIIYKPAYFPILNINILKILGWTDITSLYIPGGLVGMFRSQLFKENMKGPPPLTGEGSTICVTAYTLKHEEGKCKRS